MKFTVTCEKEEASEVQRVWGSNWKLIPTPSTFLVRVNSY
jgi:hypothetical protein